MQAINFLCYDIYRKALIQPIPGRPEERCIKERLSAGALAGTHVTSANKRVGAAAARPCHTFWHGLCLCMHMHLCSVRHVASGATTSRLLVMPTQLPAGMTATITCFPMDLVRTRLLSTTAYSNAFAALRTIASQEGIGALYVGCLPAVFAMAPAGAVFYGSYDLLKHNHMSNSKVCLASGH